MWIYYTEYPYEGRHNITGGFTSLEAAIKDYETSTGEKLPKSKRTDIDDTLVSFDFKYHEVTFEKMEIIK